MIGGMASAFDEVARALRQAVATYAPRLRALDEADSARPWSDGKWTSRQVLGHLCDSAFNNYHRVVRAQAEGELRFPGYQQEHWMAAGGYAERAWDALVDLWAALNEQLAHALARVPASHLATPCFIGEGAPVTLEFVARDYLRHLEHHLGQILEPQDAAGKTHAPFAER
jgi:hypothetical protein